MKLVKTAKIKLNIKVEDILPAFCCIQCGFKLNADLNAGRNICNKGLDVYKALSRADVNQPIVGVPEALLTSLQPCAGGN